MNINYPTIITPNSIIYEDSSEFMNCGETYNGFYISYNDCDAMIYGDVTTALVLGQMQKFYILNGNHTDEYKKIAKEGFYRCMEYFKKNINLINKYSDMPS